MDHVRKVVYFRIKALSDAMCWRRGRSIRQVGRFHLDLAVARVCSEQERCLQPIISCLYMYINTHGEGSM